MLTFKKKIKIEGSDETEITISLTKQEVYNEMDSNDKEWLTKKLDYEGYIDDDDDISLLEKYRDAGGFEINRLIQEMVYDGRIRDTDVVSEHNNILEETFDDAVSKLIGSRRYLTKEQEEYLMNLIKNI